MAPQVADTVASRSGSAGQATRADVSSYYEYLVDLHEEQVAEWGDWAVPATECVPCLAETAPHTCI